MIVCTIADPHRDAELHRDLVLLRANVPHGPHGMLEHTTACRGCGAEWAVVCGYHYPDDRVGVPFRIDDDR